MVCTWPSARSLAQSRSEGAGRENMAKADLSASVKAISVSPKRSSGRLAQPLCTKRKSASAARCFRPGSATMDMANPITRTSKRSRQGVFSHRCLRKASAADTVITSLGGSSGIAASWYSSCEQAVSYKYFLGKYLSRISKFDQVIALQERFEAQLQAPRLSISFGICSLGMTRQ